MRLIDDASLEALGGSRPADVVQVTAWFDGDLVFPEPLDVVSWSASDAAGDSVKVGQQFDVTVADPDGVLGAWRFDDGLGVAGTRLRIVYRVGGAGALNYGWFRVVGNEPSEVTEARVIDEDGYVEPDGLLPPGKRRRFVTRAVVRLSCVDLTADVDRDRFEAPESPPAAATVLSEFGRLTADHFPTVVDDGVANATVSRQLVYDRERLDACQDLLARVSARYRMGGDGECHVYPLATDPVLTIEPNVSLVSVSRKQSIEGLYNRWVVEGKDGATGSPVVGAASLDSGPLRFGGPHGRVRYFYTSEMITTTGQALAYAETLRDQFLGNVAVELDVESIPHPHLQAGDRVLVGCPVTAGHLAYLPGTVTAISRGGDPVPGPDKYKVQCSYADVVAALSRTDWAKHLPQPPAMWNQLPGSWGSLGQLTWNEL